MVASSGPSIPAQLQHNKKQLGDQDVGQSLGSETTI